jgi:hypothetical protein
MTSMTADDKSDLDEMAAKTVRVFPTLDFTLTV